MTLTHPEIRYLIRLLGGEIINTGLTGQDAIALRGKLVESIKDRGAFDDKRWDRERMARMWRVGR